MHIKFDLAQLADIPPFDSIREEAVRHAYEQSARALESAFGERVGAIVAHYIDDPMLAAALRNELMYLLTHTEVQYPPIFSSTD